MEKVCTKCEETQGYSSFFRDRTTQDGLKPFCIRCATAYEEGFYDPNPARRRAYNRKFQGQVSDTASSHDTED